VTVGSAPLTRGVQSLPRQGRLSVSVKLHLTLEILRAYIRVQRALARRNLPKTIQVLRRRGPDSTIELETEVLVTAMRLGRAVQRLLNHVPFDSRCLARSLVLTCLLDRRDIPSVLVIGVRASPQFAAHAWVETAGFPLLPAGDASYQRIAEL
jgi:Transglutaminase-like superfamily